MKIFILGAFGFIGTELCRKLNQLQHDVITDLRYWDEKFDVVINLAAVTNIQKEFNPMLIQSNIILVDKVFKRSERIIQASSCSAKYNTNPYAQSKMYAEYLTLKHNNAIALRFHNVYGLGASRGIVFHLMNLKDGEKLVVHGPDTIRDYIHVDNVANEIILSIPEYWFPPNEADLAKSRINKGVHDVGTGVGTSTMDLINLYQGLSDKRFDISISEAGDNEPISMISDRVVPHIDLETGLRKMILENKK